MVSGERAFQAARLFVLHNHEVIMRLHCSVEELRGQVDEVKCFSMMFLYNITKKHYSWKCSVVW